MGFIKYSIAFVMISLFAIALVTFSINFGIDNNAYINIGDDEDFNTMNTELRNNMSNFYTSVGVASESYAQSTISSQTEASEGGTQFKVTPWNSLSMSISSIRTSWTRIFGKDSEFLIIFTALISCFTFIMIMYAYKSWVGRNPD